MKCKCGLEISVELLPTFHKDNGVDIKQCAFCGNIVLIENNNDTRGV